VGEAEWEAWLRRSEMKGSLEALQDLFISGYEVLPKYALFTTIQTESS